jgi:hypothetical protein
MAPRHVDSSSSHNNDGQSHTVDYSPAWLLAVIQLVFYIIGAFPLLLTTYLHRSSGHISGFIYLILTSALQIVGNALMVAAGKEGTPSEIAIILTSVGLSTLLMGIVGVMELWLGGTRMGRNDKMGGSGGRWTWTKGFHLGAVVGLVFVIIGADETVYNPGASWPPYLARIGAVVLLLVWAVLTVVFISLAFRYGAHSNRFLLFAVAFSIPVLGVRYVFEAVTLFQEYGSSSATSSSSSSNSNALALSNAPIWEQVALKAVPSGLIVLFLVAGGLFAAMWNRFRGRSGRDGGIDRTATIPLTQAESGEYNGPPPEGQMCPPPMGGPQGYAPLPPRYGRGLRGGLLSSLYQ